jgi:hypothetical protein
MYERLEELYPNRILSPESIESIPNNIYMVYILTYNNKAIVLGHGKKNRSKVIFDDINQITSSHLKAFFVRLYNLFGNGTFDRYIILTDSKQEALEIEGNLHQKIGGNHRQLPEEIRGQLFDGIERNSVTELVLEIALRSSFDGLSDLRK